jgi:hypothetical protein
MLCAKASKETKSQSPNRRNMQSGNYQTSRMKLRNEYCGPGILREFDESFLLFNSDDVANSHSSFVAPGVWNSIQKMLHV